MFCFPWAGFEEDEGWSHHREVSLVVDFQEVCLKVNAAQG
jgi:hypothetical protein